VAYIINCCPLKPISAQENTGELAVPGKKSLQLVDVPGHGRIRDTILDKYAGKNTVLFYIYLAKHVLGLPDPHPDALVRGTYGYEDPHPHPGPYQNVTDPQHCNKEERGVIYRKGRLLFYFQFQAVLRFRNYFIRTRLFNP